MKIKDIRLTGCICALMLSIFIGGTAYDAIVKGEVLRAIIMDVGVLFWLRMAWHFGTLKDIYDNKGYLVWSEDLGRI